MSYVILATQSGAAHLDRRTDSKWWHRKHGQNHPFGTSVARVHTKHFNFVIFKRALLAVANSNTSAWTRPDVLMEQIIPVLKFGEIFLQLARLKPRFSFPILD